MEADTNAGMLCVGGQGRISDEVGAELRKRLETVVLALSARINPIILQEMGYTNGDTPCGVELEQIHGEEFHNGRLA